MDALITSNALQSPQRLAALRSIELIDSAIEEPFDRLTRIASGVTRSPTATISLIDAHRQFFKSMVGIPEPWASMRQIPLSHSFCQYVVTGEEMLLIRDAHDVPLVSHNPAVEELGVVAYLGIPLITNQGYAVGTFCLIDHEPRTWTRDEILLASEMARITMVTVELRSELMRSVRAQLKTGYEQTESQLRAEVDQFRERYTALLNEVVGLQASLHQVKSALEKIPMPPIVRTQLDTINERVDSLIGDPVH